MFDSGKSKVDLNALGRAIDTTWGVSSTPVMHTRSIKFTLQGNILTARYSTIVNFEDRGEMISVKQNNSREAIELLAKAIASVKRIYKEESGGLNLKIKEIPDSSSEEMEIIGHGVHNPKRTSYFTRRTRYEIG
jgi:hypothetical protein